MRQLRSKSTQTRQWADAKNPSREEEKTVTRASKPTGIQANLEAIFSPMSIAVIGASQVQGSVGRAVSSSNYREAPEVHST